MQKISLPAFGEITEQCEKMQKQEEELGTSVVVYSRASQNVVQEPAASAPPENLEEMQIFSPVSSPSIALGYGLTKPPGNSNAHKILKTTVVI